MKYLADSRAEAEEKVENDWNNQQYVLDNKHFVGAEFHARETERETIKVLLIKPNVKPEVAYIGIELKDMQRVVGGYIQDHLTMKQRLSVMMRENRRAAIKPGNLFTRRRND